MAFNIKRDIGPLHRLLLKACPPHEETSDQSIARLASLLGCTRAALYKKIKVNKIEPELALRIVDASHGRVSLDDFDVFVFVMPVGDEASPPT